MDELIVFLLFGWVEMLVGSKSKNAGVIILVWLLVIGLVITGIVLFTDSPEASVQTPPQVEVQYSPTEQSFIDLCKSRDGTVSRDLTNPEKMICI